MSVDVFPIREYAPLHRYSCFESVNVQIQYITTHRHRIAATPASNTTPLPFSHQTTSNAKKV